jgi:hypothetical protein
LPTLPDDPAQRGRLFRAARSLLGWSQAGLACAAGVGTALVYRVEAGCPGSGARAVAALAAAVERAGVVFLSAGDAAGHGLRYAARGGSPGPSGGGCRADPLATAAACVARQRAVVARLEASGAGAGAEAELALRLLREMERALAAMNRSRELIKSTGTPDTSGGRAPAPRALAA